MTPIVLRIWGLQVQVLSGAPPTYYYSFNSLAQYIHKNSARDACHLCAVLPRKCLLFV